jgi:hypothetical protein
VDLLSFDLDWVIDVVEIDVFDGYVPTPSLTSTYYKHRTSVY